MESRILVIDDEPDVCELLAMTLEGDGSHVVATTSAGEAFDRVATEDFDVVLTDLNMKEMDGLLVCQRVGTIHPNLPVIVVTARETVADRIKGLNTGADDYLCKPFDFDELVARLRAILRRRAGQAVTILEHRELTLNVATRQVVHRGQMLNVSAKEFAVLEILLQRPGIVITRAQLHDKLYGWDQDVESNTVEVYIHSLRRKLGHGFIENVRSVGYRIPAP